MNRQNTLRFWLLLCTMAAALIFSGCGGSSSSDPSPDDPAAPIEISGTASAPGGMVAQFESKSVFDVAVQFLVPPAAAAISGLQPVTGADVELIRVDNDGNQVGDVLANATTTSITGNYTLEIPAGTSLAGNLIVRITGTNNNDLRAQVVEQEVDIDPISEYVLQKFIDRGADLENLETNRVAALSGQADEFDLTAGANLSEMLATLEQEIGDFVDGQVDTISTPDGNVTEIAGDFRSSAIQFSLREKSDERGFSDFNTELFGSNLAFTDNGGGEVTIEASDNPSAFASLSGADGGGGPFVFYEAEVADIETDTFIAPYTDNGVVTISSSFEERFEGDFGTRIPPAVFRLQSTLDRNLFFSLGQEAAVDFATVDTNDDGQKDAVDPDQKIAREVRRDLSYLARLPENATDADLTGDFGLVSLRAEYTEGAGIQLESETSGVSFDGAGSLSVTGGSLLELGRDSFGNKNSAESTATDETLTLSLDADGTISAIGGDPADGFVNDTFDFVAIPSFDGANPDDGTDFAEFSQTLLIKLPDGTAPALTERTYRVFLLSASFDNKDIYIYYTGFDSTLTFSSETEGNLVADYSFMGKAGGLAGDVSVEDFPLDNTLDVSLDGTGSLSMTAPQSSGGPGVTSMDGFMNADGSLGLLRTSFDTDGDGPEGINDLGLMVLVEIAQ